MGDFRSWLLAISMVVLCGPFQPAFSEDSTKKSLEDLLVEKGVIAKDDLKNVRQVRPAPWIDSISFGGDLRLRYEYFNFRTGNAPPPAGTTQPEEDHGRARFRLRFGTEIALQQFLVGIRLASGTGSQTGTNQTFDNLSSQKQIWIDRAYLRWNAADWLSVTGGKMPLPFFRIASTDIVWDDDVSPEGFAENFRATPMDGVVIFLNAGQFVLDDDTGDSNSQWMFGQQAGADVVLYDAAKLTLAAADYYPTNISSSTLSQVTVQDGNSRGADCGLPAGVICGRFNIVDVTLQFAAKVGPLPVTVMGDWVRNTQKTPSGKNFGFQSGVILGKAAAPNSWEAAYFYKYSETDSTLADLADSDFGNGGTNRKGHIAWIAYNITRYLQGRAKLFSTQVANETYAPFKNSIDRFQADFLVYF